VLFQAYFDRWQIEVNHREIKDTLGIGQAQLRNPHSVPRQPAMLVAAYSALLLASIQVFGDTRSVDFPALPKWRRTASRPSCLDLVTLLRQQIADTTGSSSLTGVSWKNLVLAKAPARFLVRLTPRHNTRPPLMSLSGHNPSQETK